MLSIRKALITSCSLALMAGWTAYSQPAFAAGLGDEEKAEIEEVKTYPRVEGEVSIEFQSDHTFKSDDPDGEVSDTYNTTETAIGVFFNPYFSVHSTLIFEPVLDLGPGEDRVFEDHGGYVSDLYAQLEIKGVRIYVGKYAPTFGKAGTSRLVFMELILLKITNFQNCWVAVSLLPEQQQALVS